MTSRRKFLEQSLKTVLLIGAGNTLQSFAAKGFRLPDRKQVLLRFALASDGHFGQTDTPFEANHNEMIGWLNREQSDRGLNFSVINGDLFHDKPEWLPLVKKKWDELQMPYYVSHGNHDQVDENVWQQTWGIPLHHSFEHKDIGFLILNTADAAGKYICPDLSWTAKQLEEHRNRKHLFVFMHIAPSKFTPNTIECPELLAMFEKQTNLRGVFHGHDHDQDGVFELNGKHYFFDSHVAGNWGTKYRGYRIVEVLADGNVLTYQMNPGSEVMVNSTDIKAK